jgi:hypothetical protein
MRRVLTLGLLAALLLCSASACTEEKRQEQPNTGLDKLELKSLPPPGNPGGGATKPKSGNAPKSE